MQKILLEIYRDETLTDKYPNNHEVEIDMSKRKARIINPWGGAWGLAKKSNFNNLNLVVLNGGGSDAYSIYSLSAMSQKVFFKIMKKDLVVQ
jgi:hypothetical protein